ncbi:MAG: hypothetical protein IPL28_15630 [Chloroflexi bacterium]|nr:hypothetical protein [Chloroflexota bacterium]
MGKDPYQNTRNLRRLGKIIPWKDFSTATFFLFTLGALLFAWLFVRFGGYKIWYFALHYPPLLFLGRALYGWPVDNYVFFICAICLVLDWATILQV